MNEQDISKLIVVGDRVLIKPRNQNERSKNGLYLPPGYQEKEEVRSGYVIKVGPGYPIPQAADDTEAWKAKEDKVRYIPLQAREGDLALFLQKGAYEIVYNDEKYFIIPQHSILLLERDELY